MPSSPLLLPDAVRATLVSRAVDGAPAEVCGVLVGRETPEGVVVTDARAVTNVADSPRTRYELAPAETVAVFDAVEDGGAGGAEDEPGAAATAADPADEAPAASATEVVGFYHSHPAGPDRPSGTDRAQARWAGYVYLVVSLADTDARDDGRGRTDAGGTATAATVGAWRWTGSDFEPVPVRSS